MKTTDRSRRPSCSGRDGDETAQFSARASSTVYGYRRVLGPDRLRDLGWGRRAHLDAPRSRSTQPRSGGRPGALAPSGPPPGRGNQVEGGQ